MHLLYDGRISGEASGIKQLHLPRQLSYLVRSLRVALHHLTKLVQLAHTLLIETLVVSWIAGGIRRNWSLRCLTIAVVAGVDIAKNSAVCATFCAAYVATLHALRISCLLAAVAVSLQAILLPLVRLFAGILT